MTVGKRVFIGLSITGVILLIGLGAYFYHTYIGTNANWNLPLAGKVIVLDPGHGGVDGGAVDRHGEIVEKEITLSISLMLRDYLQEAGAYVLMTRESDHDLAPEDVRGYSRRKTHDLYKRLEMINASNRDLFISIHLNAIPSPRWRGAQTFYNPTNEDSERLSRFIQDELRVNLENTDRLAKKLSNVFILKEAKIPGAIVEVGFLSNPSEAELLREKEYQNKVAASIYQGILRYYTNEDSLEK